MFLTRRECQTIVERNYQYEDAILQWIHGAIAVASGLFYDLELA